MKFLKFLNSIKIIILGIIIFLIGSIWPTRYETAKEKGYEVDATIVEVKIEEDYALEVTSYTLYVDYEFDGKKYEHVEVGESYDTYDTGENYEGKVIKVVVNPNSPGEIMEEGGILCMLGFILTIAGIVAQITGIGSKIKSKKST